MPDAYHDNIALRVAPISQDIRSAPELHENLATFAVVHRPSDIGKMFEFPRSSRDPLRGLSCSPLALLGEKVVQPRNVLQCLGQPDYFGHATLRPAASLSSHAVTLALLTASPVSA